MWDDEYDSDAADGDEGEEGAHGVVYVEDVEDDTLFDQYGDFRDQEALEVYVEGYCPPWALAGEYGLDSLTVINVDDEIIHYEPGADEEYLRDGCYLFDTNFEAAASEIWHFRRLLGPVPVGGTEDFDVRSRFISHADEFESAHETGHPETCDCPACHLIQKIADAEWWAEHLAKMTNDEFAAFVDDMYAAGISAKELQTMMDEWFTEAAEEVVTKPREVEDPVTQPPEPEAYDYSWLKDDEWMTYGNEDGNPPSYPGVGQGRAAYECSVETYLRNYQPAWALAPNAHTNTASSSSNSASEETGVGEGVNPVSDWRGFSDYIPDYTERFSEGWDPDDESEHEDMAGEADWDDEDPWGDDTEKEEEEWEDDEDWGAQDTDDSLFDQHGDFRDEQAFASYFEGYEPQWTDESGDDDDNDETAVFEGDELPF